MSTEICKQALMAPLCMFWSPPFRCVFWHMKCESQARLDSIHHQQLPICVYNCNYVLHRVADFRSKESGDTCRGEPRQKEWGRSADRTGLRKHLRDEHATGTDPMNAKGAKSIFAARQWAKRMLTYLCKWTWNRTTAWRLRTYASEHEINTAWCKNTSWQRYFSYWKINRFLYKC